MNDIFNKIFNFVKSPKFYGPIIAILVAYIIYTRYEKKQAAKSKDSVKSVA